MSLSNLDRVNKGLGILYKGLYPFVETKMKEEYQQYWDMQAAESFPVGHFARNQSPDEWDVSSLLMIMIKHWQKVFSQPLGHQEKAWVSELIEVRKRSAHQNKNNKFDTDDAFRALDNVERLLTAIAAEEADDAENEKNELLRIRFEEASRKKAKKIEAQPLELSGLGNLKPWKLVIEPHPDVASGNFQQAEFAADLWKVYQEKSSAGEYGDPIEFFQRTYLTGGIKKLLKNALKRLNGEGGDPVINLQTNFGGGKTHSLLALYHLFSGTNFSSVRDLEDFFQEVGDLKPPKKVNRAVIVGNRITPGVKHKKDDGTVVNTIWGEIAWQLGKKEGYQIVKESDEIGKNPGDQLTVLFRKYSPCIVLVDEWVAYLRQLSDSEGLVCGTYDTHTSFAQALTETVRIVPNAMVVVSLPASDAEMGGTKGVKAAVELGNVIGRTEASWSAATQEESFEIVTRRLFSKIINKDRFTDRDTTARAFGEFYRNNAPEFPSNANETNYEKRIKDFFPIHPELFDLLSKRWASIDGFQKTRGILRLMAKIINNLWENNDGSPLILPANLPLDESSIQEEMLRYLPDSWRAVIHSDVDGTNALPKQIDAGNNNLGRYSATRRVARTLFFGSAPTYQAAERGLDMQRIKLGSVLPHESIAVFSDAVRYLADKATYVYEDGQHYWYSDKNNITRTAEERAQFIEDDPIDEKILSILQSQLTNQAGYFNRIHFMPKTSGDIPDDMDMKLVVLDIKSIHVARSSSSSAYQKASDILSTKGQSPRIYRNTLFFLAPDANQLPKLKEAVRLYLAWKEILDKKEQFNLDVIQTKQAESKVKTGLDTIKLRLPETYLWIFTPYQEKGTTEVLWDECRMNGSAQETYNARITRKLINQSLLYNDFAATLLRMNLDGIPLWRGNDVAVRQLREDFAKYLYLPKLIISELLRNAIQEGLQLQSWQKDAFAYADTYDEDNNRYKALRAGVHVNVSLDGVGLIVKPEIAAAQLTEEKAQDDKNKIAPNANTKPISVIENSNADNTAEENPETAVKRRFYGDVHVDAIRFFRDTENIDKEVLKHLISHHGTHVTISIHIEATNSAGFGPDIERTLKENGRTLDFGTVEFE